MSLRRTYTTHRGMIGALLLFGVANLLRPVARNPDSHFGLSAYLGTLSIFVWWLMGIYSSGRTSRHWTGAAWNPFAGYIHHLIAQHPQAILFQSSDSIIIDAKKLAKMLDEDKILKTD